ncbi:hypothetical protein LY78DRAFT_43342 [Colletotrichum sublineola]|nr:hypothetical protein LY78DRAFT_43342 [Colletotrichum sublineola]
MYHEIMIVIFFQHHSITPGIRQLSTLLRRGDMAPATIFNGAARFILLGLARLEPWHAHWHTILNFTLDSIGVPRIILKDKVHVRTIPKLLRRTGRLPPKKTVRLVQVRLVPSTVVGSHNQPSNLAIWALLYSAVSFAPCYTRLDLAAFDLAILRQLKFMTKFCLSDIDYEVSQAAASHSGLLIRCRMRCAVLPPTDRSPQ